MNNLPQGAEARVSKTPKGLLKERLRKTYRHPKLDAQLIKLRTRKEIKVLQKLATLGVPAPRVITSDDHTILMTFLEGKPLREVLDVNPRLVLQVGAIVSNLHDAHLIHGDLTTSNFIVDNNQQVLVIDFGLSMTSTRIEDKAVDLHLFRQALASKHPAIAKETWNLFLKSYRPKEKADILKRLVKVEQRGRNKE